MSRSSVSRELLADRLPPLEEMIRRIEAEARAFAALPPEEQARIRAEREAADAVRRAAYETERCTACGCHPDEHNDR